MQVISPTPGSDSRISAWYVVRVKPNAEKVVTKHLVGRGMQVFLPVQRRPRRRQTSAFVSIPLFPGYVFCKFHPADLLPVLTVRGVLYVLSREGRPEAVAESEMHALQRLCERATSLSAIEGLAPGQKVRILSGPLAGVEGLFVREGNQERLVVSLTLLQRSVIAEIDSEWVADVCRFKSVTAWSGAG